MEIPWTALLGGMLLGLSATLLLLFNGKIAGISGIAAATIKTQNWPFSWQLCFIGGMLLTSWFSINKGYFMLPQQLPSTALQLMLAGLLVGLGTRLGNGCTSGHGICGIGRLSQRSIVATLLFMLVAMLTVFIRYHL